MIYLLGLTFLFLLPGLALSFRSATRNESPLPSQKLKAANGVISYSQLGQGPDLLLIHGLGASQYSWRFVARILASQFRVTTIDLLGFGESEKLSGVKYDLDFHTLNLMSAIDQLQIRPRAIVGSSMGGLLALWLSVLYPERFPKVVALAPAIYGAKYLSLWPLKLLPMAEGLSRLFVNRWTLSWIVPLVVGTWQVINRETIKYYLRPFQEPNSIYAFFMSLHTLADFRMPESLCGLKSPVLLVWGKSDAQVDQKVVSRAKSHLPSFQYVEIKSAHHPHEHLPEKISDLIKGWVALDEHPEKPDQSHS